MVSKHILLASVLFLVLAVTSSAGAQGQFNFGIGFLAGAPQGEFSDKVDSNGYGLNLRATYLPDRHSLWSVGGEFGWLLYGSETRSERLIESIPDVTVDVRTTNNIVMGHAFLRLQKPTGILRPYAEGLVGASYFYTETAIEDDDSTNSFAASTNLDDSALSYGAGIGVAIVPYRVRFFGHRTSGFQFGFEAGVRYLKGARASYLKEGSIERRDGKVTYHVSKSETDLLLPHVGLIFRF